MTIADCGRVAPRAPACGLENGWLHQVFRPCGARGATRSTSTVLLRFPYFHLPTVARRGSLSALIHPGSHSIMKIPFRLLCLGLAAALPLANAAGAELVNGNFEAPSL